MKLALNSIATYLPEKVLTNDDLSKTLDTSHEWIYTRTGIERRHIVENETAADIGYKAAIKTLEQAGKNPEDVDAIIVSTTTHDQHFPSCAAKIQNLLGAHNAFALDVNAACAGFIYGLSVADGLIKTLNKNNVLLICTEVLTKHVDWSDRATCVLFGDGAGALLFEKQSDISKGIIGTNLKADATGEKYGYILSCDPSKEEKTYMTMNGRAVFKHAIDNMATSMLDLLNEHNMTLDDVDWIVPHQANRRIIESMCKMYELPEEKVVITTGNHANTSSASIPLAIRTAMDDGRIKPGQTLLLSALGAGFVWGSAILKL
ncbi:MAG: ketoacyl-ACP synthase III [Alphaproteobacteria bacterium]|nr:ketoacyl-ACP synthase III [Alphaproteobacteria bacterium]